ncbi:Crp/Fnr family transcriptional regulator [Thiohalophilus sp.]|uniref:Crp/Fnr family transcriptional regulator n=1 Tax=Thiohalophilus sp. TaxID=3028392 RepID=UPI002ACE0513|nr:Crp/Fnr family transcriptional regulator [Thiohalophilus sp.]MDZ7663308.1 Crp/Fnr family transcriptional regulator [Thiohalophilus sp.]
MKDLPPNNINMPQIPVVEMFPDYFPEELVKRARLLSLRTGEALFSNNEPIHALYRVIKGRLSLVHHTFDGDEIVLMRAYAGEFIAECSVCCDIYTCHARADVDSQIASLPLADFDRWLYEDSSFTRAWALDMARRLKEQFMRYERLSIRGARERILHYLYAEARADGVLDLAGSYVELATELGLTKETVYRTLAALEAEGVITRRGRHIHISRGPRQM